MGYLSVCSGIEAASVAWKPLVRWWHAHVWDATRHLPRPGVQIRYIEGRIRFGDRAGGRAPFGSAIVVFRPVEVVP
jgi:hypothetical protein